MGRGSTGLTDKQMRFVTEYLVDSNATQAAIRAGYSAKTSYSIGEENLRKPEIQAAIKVRQQIIAEETETEAEWVRRRLKEEADDHTEFATHAGRIRALELIGKINGVFELDNRQKGGLFDNLPRNVLKDLAERMKRLSGEKVINGEVVK